MIYKNDKRNYKSYIQIQYKQGMKLDWIDNIHHIKNYCNIYLTYFLLDRVLVAGKEELELYPVS